VQFVALQHQAIYRMYPQISNSGFAEKEIYSADEIWIIILENTAGRFLLGTHCLRFQSLGSAT